MRKFSVQFLEYQSSKRILSVVLIFSSCVDKWLKNDKEKQRHVQLKCPDDIIHSEMPGTWYWDYNFCDTGSRVLRSYKWVLSPWWYSCWYSGSLVHGGTWYWDDNFPTQQQWVIVFVFSLAGKFAQVTNNPENDGCINAVLLVWWKTHSRGLAIGPEESKNTRTLSKTVIELFHGFVLTLPCFISQPRINKSFDLRILCSSSCCCL